MKELLMYRLGVAALFVAVLTPAKGTADVGYKLKDEVDLCHRRPGVEPNGEHLANPGDDLIVYTNWTITDPTEPHRCLMRFSTCDYCHLHVQVETSFHYRQCPSPEAQKVYDGWCVPGCTYLHLYDQDYSNQTAASYTSSSSNLRILDFRTESRFLYMIACSNRSLDNDVFFHLKITAEDKTKYFRGTSAEIGRPQVFASPFFPEEYVLNSEVYKYVFQAVTLDEFITISFDDWQLSQYSSILFDSANIRGKIWGTNYRPWIISDKSRLEMTFETGPYRIPGTLRAFKGFRATYTFHSEDREDVPYVHTNCGWWIERQESGTVTFNPTANGYDYYDCIWVIKKHPNFQRILVKVINYSTRDTYRHNQPNLLEIRNGLTSRGRLVESVVPSSSPDDIQVFRAHDSDTGFYVRIKGHYFGQRDFVLAYTCFNTDNCRDMFRCANDRCVPSDVTCNGIDNCGDNSDETESGCGGGAAPSGARYTSPINVGIIIPMVVSVFLIVVICLLVIFIRRCRRLSCQARRAQRRQQRINTVSGTVSRQQRRRRRGEHRREELGQPHDPPPSYEDVLNNTPIGYLNLGFFDASYSTTDPIQPPSYDEAISPSAVNPPGFGFQGSESHDLSSDSSSPETVERSQLNLSTSYSSDDTHTAENQHRSRQRAVSSSSDSSNDIGGSLSNAADRQSGESSGTGSRGNGEESERTEGGPANTRRSIAKPDDSTIQLPVSSPADIVHHKDAKPNNKMQNARGNEGDDLPIISENLPPCSGTVPFADPESGERTSQPSSVCRVEMSPVIAAPSLLSLTSHQGRSAPDSGQAHGGAPPPADLSNGASSRSRSVDLAPEMQAVGRCLSNEGASCAPGNEASPPRQERYGRPSPSRNIPPHIRKAKGGSSGMTMKHLSRSMDHIDRRCAQGEGDHALASMPPRLFSQSVHNIFDAPPGRNERDGNHLAPLQRGCHRYQSQPLALGELPRRRDFSPEDVGPSTPESEPHPANGRQDRPRLDQDHGERRHDRSGSDQYPSPRCPEAQERGPRPQTLPRERNASQPGDRTTKPAPKPRKVCPPPGERGNDPEGRSNRPDPRGWKSHPPGERGNDPDGRPTRPDLRPMQTRAPEERLNNPDDRPVRPDPRPRQAHPPGLRGDKPAERGRRYPEQPGSPQRCEAGYAYGAQHLARDEPPPPYSRSLDWQRADPTHSRNPSMPHPQRNAFSLERNGQHPGIECRANGDAHGRPDLLDDRDRRGPSPAKASRPSQLPKPDGTPGPHPSQSQERRNLSGNQEAHHPGRTSGPPPFRASDSSRTHRPSDLRIPVGHQDQSRDQQGGPPDQNRGPDAFNQRRDTRHPKPDCAPKPARTARPSGSAGSVPQMSGRSAARPERGLEGGGRREASQRNNPGPGSTTAGRTNSPEAPYRPTPHSAPNSAAASPHSPTPVSLLKNAPSVSRSSAPDAALKNTYGAPCSPTANAGPRSPAPESPQSTTDSSYSTGSPAHPNITVTNSSTGGQLDSTNTASGLNTNTDSALRATTTVDAFSAARMFPSPSSSGAAPAPFLSLRTGDVDEEEDIYV